MLTTRTSFRTDSGNSEILAYIGFCYTIGPSTLTDHGLAGTSRDYIQSAPYVRTAGSYC